MDLAVLLGRRSFSLQSPAEPSGQTHNGLPTTRKKFMLLPLSLAPAKKYQNALVLGFSFNSNADSSNRAGQNVSPCLKDAAGSGLRLPELKYLPHRGRWVWERLNL